MPDMRTKRQVLTDLLVDALAEHRIGVRAEQRFRRATAPDTSRRDRIKVMGDVCYYLEVLHSGGRESTVDVNGGASIQMLHTFQVSLFLQYEDSDEYAASSQAVWDLMTEGQAPDPLGILETVDTTVVLGTGDDRCSLRQTAEVTDDVIPLDMASTEAAHMLTFQVQIEG